MARSADRSEAVRPHTKRMGREVAMQYLYSCETRGELPTAATFDAFFEMLCAEYKLRDDRLVRKTREYATMLYQQAALHGEEIDAILRPKCDESWGWERIDAVDRNVLRVCLAELLYDKETPKLVWNVTGCIIDKPVLIETIILFLSVGLCCISYESQR